ncbi:DUF7342 family protein [Haladaptatus pallidirubidus]|uniref:Uncharacterized protein n=1 Tax=Haladaptatus pallidirubidus TaxID=1008152 RepID=A0AAV3URG8_9EURY|nr:hypothetical protein [Haladaptatus pallidirubidus]
MKTETERAETLAGKFDVASPTEVSLSNHATDTGQSVEEVWEDISAWKSSRCQITLLERALTTDSGDAACQRTAV